MHLSFFIELPILFSIGYILVSAFVCYEGSINYPYILLVNIAYGLFMIFNGCMHLYYVLTSNKEHVEKTDVVVKKERNVEVSQPPQVEVLESPYTLMDAWKKNQIFHVAILCIAFLLLTLTSSANY